VIGLGHLAHRLADRVEESPAGVLHQMPTIGDLGGMGELPSRQLHRIRRRQLPSIRRAWRAGALSKRVLGHPAALEPVPSRSGDHDQRPAGSRRTDAIGAAIDETRAKRGAIVLALAVLGIGAITL
jgi:hypothetical protein